MASSSMKRWTIATFELSSVSEGSGVLSNSWRLLSESQPAPEIAKRYYANPEGGHVPTHPIETLYDTFLAIRDDEAEHAHSMERLQL